MIENLYSEYDTDITIRPKQGKTANEARIDFEKLAAVEGVVNYTRAIEEVVVLQHEKKRINADLVGVDSTFIEMTNLNTKKHLVDGEAMLTQDTLNFGIIGATLLDNLDGYVPENVGYESLICYAPKRKIRMRLGKSPFVQKVVRISGRMNYNREVNAKHFVVPIDLARELFQYEDQISAVYVDIDPSRLNRDAKEDLQEVVGDDFVVKTNFEKNELIYQTSKTEKLIVIAILVFIFILAAFNLVASLTMLFVEKLSNIETMISFGADKRFIFRIFFYEGLIIAGKGIFFGVLAGYTICAIQLFLEPLVMPNSGGEAFPISLSFKDGALIIALVSTLSILFSYFPVKYLIRKNVKA